MIEIPMREGVGPPSGVRKGFIDECQDNNLLEAKLLFEHWAPMMEALYLCGDPHQVLYRFRGADPSLYINPEIPESSKIKLNRSYRLPERILDYAESWLDHAQLREPIAYSPRCAGGQLVDRPQWSSSRPERMVEEAWDLAKDGKTVMILATCGYMLKDTIAELRGRGIPYGNPYRPDRWNPMRHVVSGGLATIDRLLAFLRPSPILSGDAAPICWSTGDYKKWIPMLGSEGMLRRGVKTAMKEWSDEIPMRLDAVFTDGSRSEAIAVLNLVRSSDPEDMREALRWLARKLLVRQFKAAPYLIRVAGMQGVRYCMEPPKLWIGTVHSVKGGEADYVYLMPDVSRGGDEAWRRHGPDRDSVVRVFYVGMTRARSGLTILGPGSDQSVPIWNA